LRDEFLCLFVERGFAGRERKLGRYSGSRFFLVARQLGGRRLRDFYPQVFLGKIFRFSSLEESHFAEHVIEFALGGIAFRVAIDELFKCLFCAFVLLIRNQGITEVRECIGDMEGVTGAAVEFHEPLERLDSARHADNQLVE